MTSNFLLLAVVIVIALSLGALTERYIHGHGTRTVVVLCNTPNDKPVCVSQPIKVTR